MSFLVSYNLPRFLLFLLLRNHPFSYPGHLYASLKLFVLVFTPVSCLGGAGSICGRYAADSDCVVCGLHSSITSAGAVRPTLARTYPVIWFCVTDRNSSVIFEVLTVVLLRIQVFRDVTPCRWVSCHGVAKNHSVFETF